MSSRLNILTIYTFEDKEILQRILKHLRHLEQDYNLTIWDDNPIHKGQQWRPQNESRLEQTDVFIFLLSNTFMHSSFVQQLEFKKVIDSYKAGSTKVIPVILQDCPWNIDFEADEYTFSFKELEVLPSDGKPINNWDSLKKACKNVGKNIKAKLEPLMDKNTQEEPIEIEEKKIDSSIVEEQTEISFTEEKESIATKDLAEEIESKRIAEENRIKKEAEAKQKVAEENKLQEERETKIRLEEEQKRQEEENRKLEGEKLENQAKTERLKEERRLMAEAETKRQAAIESKLEEENRRKVANETTKEIEEMEQEIDSGLNKKLIVFAAITAITAITILGVLLFRSGSDKESQSKIDTKVAEVEDSVLLEKVEVEPVAEEETTEEMLVGDFYKEGMVFHIDSDFKKGKIVHLEDAGPMTWKNAMQIHEQLGEGWRIPTLDELKLIRKTVGQGANNNAEFSDGLYWSATDYDQYQARLLRFRDGNTSYHYNKEAGHRKYRVRAIRDFSR